MLVHARGLHPIACCDDVVRAADLFASVDVTGAFLRRRLLCFPGLREAKLNLVPADRVTQGLHKALTRPLATCERVHLGCEGIRYVFAQSMCYAHFKVFEFPAAAPGSTAIDVKTVPWTVLSKRAMLFCDGMSASQRSQCSHGLHVTAMCEAYCTAGFDSLRDYSFEFFHLRLLAMGSIPSGVNRLHNV